MFDEWVGRQSIVEDDLTDRMCREFVATFSPHLSEFQAEAAPQMIHWCLAPTIVATDELASDGHPPKGGFLPPIPLPRRMSAGGEVDFVTPLKIGRMVRRTSTIQSVGRKQGRTGELWLVNVGHEISQDGTVAIREIQTIVYRGADSTAVRGLQPSVPDNRAQLCSRVDTSPVRLFRYSAITFNCHRIHYDEPYTRSVEKYPGLVVHGPVQSTLLLHHATKLLKRLPTRLEYRSTAPLVAGPDLELRAEVNGALVRCCVCDAQGQMTMDATVT
jgi:3-methylfumaryl-CoA hydratase